MTFKTLAAALLAGALGMGAAEAATQSFTGCPIRSWSTWAAGQKVSISWAFQGLGPVIAFQPNGVVYGGGIAPLTPEQAAAYGPTLNELRMAAQSRKKVTIYWDSVTKQVATFITEWNQSC
jgi:hypothetical protein